MQFHLFQVGERLHTALGWVDEQLALTYMVVDINFMLYPPDKEGLHVGSRSPPLCNCLDCKAAAQNSVSNNRV